MLPTCIPFTVLAERYNEYLQSITLEKYITSMEGPGVGKQLTEDDLREHGFTDKEIARLREILTRQESHNETYATLIDSLRKRFWGGVIVVCIAFAIVVSWIFNFESNDFTYPLIIIFILIAVWKLTPFQMAFKHILST